MLNALYSRCIRLSLIWLIPALVFFAVIAKPFFAIWAGHEFAAESTLPFYILLAGIAFNIVAYLPNAAILAAGKTDVLAKLYWLELAVYAVVVWFLASQFGAVGAAVAWSLRVVVDALVQFVLAKRVAHVEFHAKKVFPLAIASAIMLVPGVISVYLGTISLLVVLLAVCCLSVYSFLVLKTTLEDEEFLWLSARFGGRLAWIRS
jgi:O-antigen/teichoic acid export membrane protein